MTPLPALWIFEAGDLQAVDSVAVAAGSSFWSGSVPFDTLAWDGTRLIDWNRHLERLGRQVPRSDTNWLNQPEEAKNQLIQELSAWQEPLRVNLYRLDSGRLVIRARPYQPPSTIMLERGVHLEVQRRLKQPRWPQHRVKRTDYGPALAYRRQRPAWDLLYTDREGKPWETTVANITWLTETTVSYPPHEETFPGIVQSRLLDACSRSGINLEPVQRSWWEVPGTPVLTNSLIGLLPVRRMGQRYVEVRQGLVSEFREKLVDERQIPEWN